MICPTVVRNPLNLLYCSGVGVSDTPILYQEKQLSTRDI
jgi:hypothetical protein